MEETNDKQIESPSFSGEEMENAKSPLLLPIVESTSSSLSDEEMEDYQSLPFLTEEEESQIEVDDREESESETHTRHTAEEDEIDETLFVSLETQTSPPLLEKEIIKLTPSVRKKKKKRQKILCSKAPRSSFFGKRPSTSSKSISFRVRDKASRLHSDENYGRCIKRSNIKKLVLKAGIPSIRDKGIKELRRIMVEDLEALIVDSMEITRYRKRSTITEGDIKEALRIRNSKIF